MSRFLEISGLNPLLISLIALLFETSFSMNVRDDRKAVEMPFEVKTSKSYNMNLRLYVEGMLTDIQIYDDKGSIAYQNIYERFTLSSSLDLKTGIYLFVLTFIRDPEVSEPSESIFTIIEIERLCNDPMNFNNRENAC